MTFEHDIETRFSKNESTYKHSTLPTLTIEERILTLEQKVACLRTENAELKTMVDWDDDPEIRRIKRSNITHYAGGFGWLIGAFGVAFGGAGTLRYMASYIPGIQEVPIVVTVTDITSFMLGFAVVGRHSEQLAKLAVVEIFRRLRS